jgi:AAA family ATP:ADP antiporter
MAIYYVLKTVRESLILTQGGAEIKSYSAIMQAIALLFIMPAYSALASRLKRTSLINWITVLFAGNLLVFAGLDHARLPIGVVFFLWLGIFSVTSVTQMWAFANDLYSEEEGKRILPLLGLAGALGALAGSQAATRIYSILGVEEIMILAAICLVICSLMTGSVDRYKRARSRTQAYIAGRPVGGDGGFRLVFNNRYFLLIAILTVLINMSNTTGEFMLSKLAIERADALLGAHGTAALKRQVIGAFYGRYFAWGSFFGLILQGVAMPRVLRGLGPRRLLLVGPAVSALGYSLVAAAPTLGVAEIAKVAENSIDYTMNRTALNALFLGTSRAAKYKAKTLIDTFFYRIGDFLQGLLVLGGASVALDVRQYAILNVLLALVSVGIVLAIDREFRRATATQHSPEFELRPRRTATLIVRPLQSC